MAQEKKERIFISYKRVDKERVFAIKDGIEQATGERCWIDLDGIESDAQFANVIVKAINRCEVFLFMYSKEHSKISNVDDDWTIKEITFAKEKKKRIVIINIDDTPLIDQFLFEFPRKQRIDASDASALARLYKDICSWLKIDIRKHQQDSYRDASNAEQDRLRKEKELQERMAQAEAEKKALEEKMRLAEEKARQAEEEKRKAEEKAKQMEKKNNPIVSKSSESLWERIGSSDILAYVIPCAIIAVAIGLGVGLTPTPIEAYKEAKYIEQTIGVKENAAEKAFRKYRKAARLGSVDAMNKVASWYANGIGTPEKEWESIKWYRKASNSLLRFEKIADNSVEVNGQGCHNMEMIIIPKVDSNKDSVTVIGNSAFLNCSTAVAIAIPNTIEKIDDFAFYGCSSLEEITIPNGVKSIGVCAFKDCKNLVRVKIPKTVENIGRDCFEDCTSLREICIPEGTREKFEAMRCLPKADSYKISYWAGIYSSESLKFPSGNRIEVY